MNRHQVMLVWLAIGICVISKILLFHTAGIKTPKEAVEWLKKEFGGNAN